MMVTIDNRIRIPVNPLKDEQRDELLKAFTYANPQYNKLKGMGRRFVPKNIPKTISTWELSGGELSVPRGGLNKVQAILGKMRVKRRFTYGDPTLRNQLPRHILELRAYQQELKAACLQDDTVLVRSPPGSGKTTVGYAVASELQLPTLVVVPTERILKQWIRGVEKNLGMEPSEVGVIQGSRRVVKPLTIGMQQTLRNCSRDYLDVFGLVIGDEAQRFAASTFFDVIDLFPSAYRVGMTADERRSDRKEFLVYDVFGPVAEEVPRSKLVEANSIIDAEVRIVPSNFEADWYKHLKPQQRADAQVQKRLSNELTENEERNALVIQVLAWCVEEGHQTITLAWRREHCATLNKLSMDMGWDSGLLIGKEDSGVNPEFEKTERELSEGILRQAVGTYQAVGVGFDLPRVNRGILAAPCANSRDGKYQFVQFVGRFERPDLETGKTSQGDSVVYYIWDRYVFGLNPVRNIARWKAKASVLCAGQWVPVKQFIKEEVKREEVKENEEHDEFGFWRPH